MADEELIDYNEEEEATEIKATGGGEKDSKKWVQKCCYFSAIIISRGLGNIWTVARVAHFCSKTSSY